MANKSTYSKGIKCQAIDKEIMISREQRVSPLFIDLYELTMAAAYHANGVKGLATFSLYVREHKLRNFFVAAGLEEVLVALEKFSFDESEIQFLKSTGLFNDSFLNYLRTFSFSGTIHAMPEGSIFFPNEPIMEVTAPIIEAQIIETFLLNQVGLSTLIATKAARCLIVARGCPLIDFSVRRTQGIDAGLKAARSSYIGGFSGTSNVLAGKKYGIPISGTMAHSFISAFENETEAFLAYAKLFPDVSVFLIDTYDTVEGARNAIKIAREMKDNNHHLIGVRIDSGDMVELSRIVRRMLDDAGLENVKIFASSGFDEFKISEVMTAGARIDAFGIGTKLGVSADAPYLDIVYKMVQLGGRGIRKSSPGKMNLAGEKQVYRRTNEHGIYVEDLICARDEHIEDGFPLLEKVMEDGYLIRSHPTLHCIRNQFLTNFSCLGDRFKTFDVSSRYPVNVSSKLGKLQ